MCVGWGSPSCDKKCLGICCGSAPCVNWKTITEGNTAAYDNATGRFNADKAAWDQCRNENKGIWVPGWRRKWREFKKYGGLNQLRDQCRGVVPEAPPTATPKPDSGLDCQGLSDTYGISHGNTWGTAESNTINNITGEWKTKGCKTSPKPIDELITGSKGSKGSKGSRPGQADSGDNSIYEKNKKMITIGVIAVVVIITISLVVRAMRSKA
jgi:hypothetical protein